jgi:hypothetical protein
MRDASRGQRSAIATVQCFPWRVRGGVAGPEEPHRTRAKRLRRSPNRLRSPPKGICTRAERVPQPPNGLRTAAKRFSGAKKAFRRRGAPVLVPGKRFVGRDNAVGRDERPFAPVRSVLARLRSRVGGVRSRVGRRRSRFGWVQVDLVLLRPLREVVRWHIRPGLWPLRACYSLAMSSTRSPASDADPQTVTELEQARADARRRLRDAVEDVRNQAKKTGTAKL